MGRKRILRCSVLIAALLCTALLFAACAAGKSAESTPVPTAAPASTPTPTAEPTPTPTPTPTPAPTPFSLLWMSDTQRVSAYDGEFAVVGEWCLEQIEPYNIQAFLHTGDIVGVRSSGFQWGQVLPAIDSLRAVLPSLLIAGNHDMHAKMMNYEDFRDRIYADGDPDPETSFNRGQGRYMLLEAGGIKWLFIGMSYQYLTAEEDWISEVLAAHPDRIAVLLLHEYLRGDGRLMKQGERMFERVVAPNDNLRLILCGHNDGFITREDVIEGENGTRTVQTIICNQQSDWKRRGTVQILTVDPVEETLSLYGYSPLREEMPPIETALPLDLQISEP